MNGTPKFSGNNGCRPYIEIYNVRENKMVNKKNVSFNILNNILDIY